MMTGATIMTRRRRVLCLLVALVGLVGIAGGSWAAGAPPGAQQGEPDLSTTTGRGQACTQWFYAQEFDKIEALGVTDAVKGALQPMGGFAGFWKIVDEQLGGEIELVGETESQQQGLDVYLRTARFAEYDGEVGVQWVFDAQGAIAGFAIRPKQ
jgi:hypothetical protein